MEFQLILLTIIKFVKMLVKHDGVIHMIPCESFRDACEAKGIKRA